MPHLIGALEMNRIIDMCDIYIFIAVSDGIADVADVVNVNM
jgi:hypothetical protein